MSEFLKDLVCYCGGVTAFIMLFIIDCINLLKGAVGIRIVNGVHRSYKFNRCGGACGITLCQNL